jgi:hypothetical protein
MEHPDDSVGPPTYGLSAVAITIFVIEALPIPVCMMGAVFALIAPGVLIQPSVGTLLVWAVILYPAVWLGSLIAAHNVAYGRRPQDAIKLAAVPAIIIVPAFIALFAF